MERNKHMDTSTTLPDSPKQNHASKMVPAHWWNSAIHSSIALTLWMIGLLTLVGASMLIRNHLGPWPVELAFTRAVQGLFYGSWFAPFLIFFGTFNNPTPSGIALGIVFAVILLMGWYRQAIFLGLTVAVGNGIETVFGNYVARLRPSPDLVRVDIMLKYNSFPSGHVNHEVLFYGFLLYLSFTRPVRTWRYRWVLIPLQVFAALNILLIGISRVYEGEHWAFDVLGGYLCGALWLALFIFLYQWTTSALERRHAKKSSSTPVFET